MCTQGCLDFVRTQLRAEDVRGRSVLEVGALDVNGTVRPIVSGLGPAHYLGVDMAAGPGVDEICDATQLIERFGRDEFDLLISTELLEHVRDWRRVISQFKQVLKPGGIALLTTRSPGFPYHAFPFDFWRFEPADLREIFSDFEIDVIESDAGSPGVFLKARKPQRFLENDTRDHAILSIIIGERALDISEAEIDAFHRREKRRRLVRAPERLVRKMWDSFFS